MITIDVDNEVQGTVDALLRFNDKAERISGRVVPMMSTGFAHNRIAGRIYVSLFLFSEQTKAGYPFSDGMGFAVPMLRSGRQSFSPDVAFFSGPPPKNVMSLITAPPTFAAEVRSSCDYGPVAESEMAAKRLDYFEAGTVVVWDVDPKKRLINCYRKSSQYTKQVFTIGQIADAEPAVPNWRLSIDDVFRD